jgi:integrase
MEESTHKKKIVRLSLTRVSEGLQMGTKSDGTIYSVRDDRSRYFFPEEWERFIEAVKEDKRAVFEFLINTGARIEEALHVKPKDFDWERNNVTLRVTKMKAAKGERIGKPRTFTISSQLARKMRAHISRNNIGDDELMFNVSKQAVYQLMRRTVKNIGIKDWYNFCSFKDLWEYTTSDRVINKANDQ